LVAPAPETGSPPTPPPDAPAGATVDRFLKTVRRRQARAVALELLPLGSATLGFGVVLAATLARAWPRGVRWVLGAAVLATVGLVAERLWRHWTRVAGDPFRAAGPLRARGPGGPVGPPRRPRAAPGHGARPVVLHRARARPSPGGGRAHRPARCTGGDRPGGGASRRLPRARGARRPGPGVRGLAGPDPFSDGRAPPG